MPSVLKASSSAFLISLMFSFEFPLLFDLSLGPWLGLDTTLRVSCQVVHYLMLMQLLIEPHGKEFLFCIVGLEHLHRQLELSVSSVPWPQVT